jgi:molecular chaperone GrpE (heat shock protein)
MAFDEEEPTVRRRRRTRSGSSEEPWPSKSEPLSWTLLPPQEEEDRGEEPGEAVAEPRPKTGAPTPAPTPAPPPATLAGEKGKPAASAPAAPAAPEPGEDWKSLYQYLMADFENYRKRVHKETDSAVAAARGRVLLRVIDLHDGIEQALRALAPDAKSTREGLSMVLRNFDNLLREEGAEPVAHVGGRFQHEFHEAVGQIPATASASEGEIAVVVQQGYRTPSGLLRPAKVLVAGPKENHPTKKEKEGR